MSKRLFLLFVLFSFLMPQLSLGNPQDLKPGDVLKVTAFYMWQYFVVLENDPSSDLLLGAHISDDSVMGQFKSPNSLSRRQVIPTLETSEYDDYDRVIVFDYEGVHMRELKIHSARVYSIINYVHDKLIKDNPNGSIVAVTSGGRTVAVNDFTKPLDRWTNPFEAAHTLTRPLLVRKGKSAKQALKDQLRRKYNRLGMRNGVIPPLTDFTQEALPIEAARWNALNSLAAQALKEEQRQIRRSSRLGASCDDFFLNN